MPCSPPETTKAKTAGAITTAGVSTATTTTAAKTAATTEATTTTATTQTSMESAVAECRPFQADLCVDNYERCDRILEPQFCTNPFTGMWARANCRKFCNFC